MLSTFSLIMVIDVSSDQLTKTFIGICNPPWNKANVLYLSDITFVEFPEGLSVGFNKLHWSNEGET